MLGEARYDPPKPSFWRMVLFPVKGDVLCFDGRRWRVARRYGWHWPVDDPEKEPNDGQ